MATLTSERELSSVRHPPRCPRTRHGMITPLSWAGERKATIHRDVTRSSASSLRSSVVRPGR